MEYLLLILGLAVGFVGGYLTASFWGKPAKLIKKAAQQGLDVASEVQKGMR